MNIAEFSIKKSVITWTLTIVLLILGYFSYENLPRLEDPEFAIKDAVVLTPYPGATPEEVEKHVKETVAIMKPGGGFVFQQVHNILANVPPENIVRMYKAVGEV